MNSVLGPTCSDNIRNQGETGVDCGGPCTVKCDNQTCSVGSDCKSGVCTRGKCQGKRTNAHRIFKG